MKAAYITQFGGTELIQFGDVSEPAIGVRDVLARVVCTTVNRVFPVRLRSSTLLDI